MTDDDLALLRIDRSGPGEKTSGLRRPGRWLAALAALFLVFGAAWR